MTAGKCKIRCLCAVAGFLLSPGAFAAPDAPPPRTLRIGVTVSPAILDPTANPSEGIALVTLGNLYEGLTRLDEKGRLQPLLAQSWQVSADGLRYDFTLRADVRFHDGAAFDCASVRYTFARAAAPESTNPRKEVFANIASVDCPAPNVASVRLHERRGDFLYDLAWASAVILSPGSAAGDATNPVGTGPYRFASWRRGDSVTLARNDGYWGEKPFFPTVAFRFFPDPVAALNALADGRLDAYPSFPAPKMLARFRDDGNFRIENGLSPFKAILALNERRAPFSDRRFRQALAYAIDRRALAEATDIPGTRVIGSHMSPDDPEFVDLAGVYPYDPAKARAMLAELKIPPGTTLRLTLPPVEYARTGGEIVAAYLEQVGLNVTFVPVEWPGWLSGVYARHDFEMTIIAHTEPHDLGIYARKDYYFGYHSDAFDALYRQYEESGDPAQRMDISHRMQKRLAEDEPNVFLFFVPRTNIANVHLRGLWKDMPLAACPVGGARWE